MGKPRLQPDFAAGEINSENHHLQHSGFPSDYNKFVERGPDFNAGDPARHFLPETPIHKSHR
ncbi:hypothetical protein PM8797T_08214 [Gimesia maris DSM 8797]|nr:hypothetical protein PM8797T_08214 [Gimesia maris DSM 8797]